MKQIRNMYRFVRLVEQLSEEGAKRNPSEAMLSGFEYDAPIALRAKEKYAEKYHKSLAYAHAVCVDACHKQNGYLSVHIDENDNKKIDCLIVTTKGRELTDTTLWILPIGLYMAWWNKFGVFISGFVIGTIPSIYFLVNWLVQVYKNS